MFLRVLWFLHVGALLWANTSAERRPSPPVTQYDPYEFLSQLPPNFGFQTSSETFPQFPEKCPQNSQPLPKEHITPVERPTPTRRLSPRIEEVRMPTRYQEINVPCPEVPAPRIIADDGKSTRTILRHKVYRRIVKQPVNYRYIKKTYVPVVQKVRYDARGPTDRPPVEATTTKPAPCEPTPTTTAKPLPTPSPPCQQVNQPEAPLPQPNPPSKPPCPPPQPPPYCPRPQPPAPCEVPEQPKPAPIQTNPAAPRPAPCQYYSQQPGSDEQPRRQRPEPVALEQPVALPKPLQRNPAIVRPAPCQYYPQQPRPQPEEPPFPRPSAPCRPRPQPSAPCKAPEQTKPPRPATSQYYPSRPRPQPEERVPVAGDDASPSCEEYYPYHPRPSPRIPQPKPSRCSPAPYPNRPQPPKPCAVTEQTAPQRPCQYYPQRPRQQTEEPEYSAEIVPPQERLSEEYCPYRPRSIPKVPSTKPYKGGAYQPREPTSQEQWYEEPTRPIFRQPQEPFSGRQPRSEAAKVVRQAEVPDFEEWEEPPQYPSSGRPKYAPYEQAPEEPEFQRQREAPEERSYQESEEENCSCCCDCEFQQQDDEIQPEVGTKREETEENSEYIQLPDEEPASVPAKCDAQEGKYPDNFGKPLPSPAEERPYTFPIAKAPTWLRSDISPDAS